MARDKSGETRRDVVIEPHPVTGQPVVRARGIARLFGARYFTRDDLLRIAHARRSPGQGYALGEPPPDTWESRALRALDAEIRRRDSDSPAPRRLIRLRPGTGGDVCTLPRIKAVVFDAFGTLVQIGHRRQPYLQLLKRLEGQGRMPQPDDAAKIMSANVGLGGVPALLGVALQSNELADIEHDLYGELSGIHLYEGVLAIVEALHSRGYKVGLCSNLAAPYALPLKLLLPKLDAYAWSFEVGAVKPDPRIYSHICKALGCEPAQVLMVGDTWDADYQGPRSFGMQARHLARDGVVKAGHSISKLDDVLVLLASHAPATSV